MEGVPDVWWRHSLFLGPIAAPEVSKTGKYAPPQNIHSKKQPDWLIILHYLIPEGYDSVVVIHYPQDRGTWSKRNRQSRRKKEEEESNQDTANNKRMTRYNIKLRGKEEKGMEKDEKIQDKIRVRNEKYRQRNKLVFICTSEICAANVPISREGLLSAWLQPNWSLSWSSEKISGWCKKRKEGHGLNLNSTRTGRVLTACLILKESFTFPHYERKWSTLPWNRYFEYGIVGLCMWTFPDCRKKSKWWRTRCSHMRVQRRSLQQ